MNILLIRLSSLGDLIIMTSALEYLKDKGNVTLVTRKQYFELFEEDSRVYQLIEEKDIKNLKNTTFDIACDLHAKPKTIFLLSKIHAHRKCVIDKNSLRRRLAVWFKKKIVERPLYKLYVEALQKYFDDRSYPLPRLISDLTKPANLPEKYVVISPGASQPQKRWPLKYFLEVSRLIYKKYCLPSVYIGMEDFNLPEKKYVINRMEKTSLKHLMSIIKFAEFTVANDSGPAHMSAALSTPLFVLFGPTIPELGFRPVSEAPVIVIERHDLKCRPCSLHGEKKCIFGDIRCLSGISPDAVFQKIEETIKL